MRRRDIGVNRGAAKWWNVARYRLADGLHDAVVAGATAEVPRQADADLFVARIGVGPQERRRRDQHARRAEAALHTELLKERPLQRPDLFIAAKTFHGDDLF